MPKNIVVFSDGTGQEGGKGNNTNVYKLFNMIEDRTERQISFYDRGLGTGWRKITGSISGVGISKNIKECYEFIFENYESGDNIFLFGFSRGATTVRSLSGFIHLFGILPRSRPELIREAYNIYKVSDERKRNTLAEALLSRHHNQWCRIKFLGVWDTVDALGLPFKMFDFFLDLVPFFRHKYHNLRLSSSVTHARQALAIDDKRLTFHPKIWDKEIEDHQTMKQVWFSGMHTDVGGGYKERELSDIPLIWMIEDAKQAGLRLYQEEKFDLIPDPNGIMHDSRKGFPKNLFRKKIRSWNLDRSGKPVVHESVSLRKLNNKNSSKPAYAPWIMKMNYSIEPWPESQRIRKFVSHREILAEGIWSGNVETEEYNVVFKDGKVIQNVDVEDFPDLPIIPSEEAFDRMDKKAEFNLEQETIALEQARTQSRGFFWLMWIFSIVGFLVIIVGITLIYSNSLGVGIITSVGGIVSEALAAIFFRKDKELRGVVSLYMDKIDRSQLLLTAIDTANTITKETEKNEAKRAIINSILSGIE